MQREWSGRIVRSNFRLHDLFKSHQQTVYRSFFPSGCCLFAMSFASYASIALSRSGRVGCEWWYIE
jgi:hypothetical protein